MQSALYYSTITPTAPRIAFNNFRINNFSNNGFHYDCQLPPFRHRRNTFCVYQFRHCSLYVTITTSNPARSNREGNFTCTYYDSLKGTLQYNGMAPRVREKSYCKCLTLTLKCHRESAIENRLHNFTANSGTKECSVS
jgi:hypothetical protein